ncbi:MULTISPECIES: helix-turn-helix domain-containing protein [Kitasatospora]
MKRAYKFRFYPTDAQGVRQAAEPGEPAKG